MTGIGELTLVFMRIGILSIGGGYAVIPMIQQQVVRDRGWLELREFVDMIAISQMTPGPLAVNTSTFVGLRLGGLPGAVAATFGCVISGVLIALVLYSALQAWQSNPLAAAVLRSLKSTSAGLILSATASIVILAATGGSGVLTFSTLDAVAIVFTASGVWLLYRYSLNPVALVAISGVGGVIAYAVPL